MRHRTCPRVVKRARHNHYPVKKPGQPASTRHDSPPTVRLLNQLNQTKAQVKYLVAA